MKILLSLVLTIVALMAPLTLLAQGNDRAVRQQLQSQGSVEEVLMDEKGLPSYIRCDLDYSRKGSTALARAWAFFDANASLFRMKAPHKELELYKSHADERGYIHLKFNQLYETLPVFQGQLIVHVNPAGHITAVNGNYIAGIAVDVHPSITIERAKEIMASDCKRTPQECDFSRESLTIFERKGHHYLAWRAAVQSKSSFDNGDFFVDAHTGEILQRLPLVVE